MIWKLESLCDDKDINSCKLRMNIYKSALEGADFYGLDLWVHIYVFLFIVFIYDSITVVNVLSLYLTNVMCAGCALEQRSNIYLLLQH
jgi:hypothetical protein